MYTRVATSPEGEFHFHRGPDYAVAMLGYSAAALAALPEEVTSAPCPPQALQVRHARLLVGEELAELEERAGVVDSGSGLGKRQIGHDHSL